MRAETEPPRDPRLHQFDDTANRTLRIIRLHEVEVALSFGWAEVGEEAVRLSPSCPSDGRGNTAVTCLVPRCRALRLSRTTIADAGRGIKRATKKTPTSCRHALPMQKKGVLLIANRRAMAAYPSGVTMAQLPNDKHKEYVRYARHCLDMVMLAEDQDASTIQREMATEWLKLADAILESAGLGRMTPRCR